jgi:hypothetical protein
VREFERFAGPSSGRVRGHTTQPSAHIKAKNSRRRNTREVRTIGKFPQSGHSEGANYLLDSAVK